MKIIANTKKINRNRKVGLYLSLGSLVVLIGGMVLSFQPALQNELAIAYGALLIGLLMSQIGIYYGNRWGRSPSIDERISAGLKGLDDRYTLYHYTSPVPHLLAGPAGLWVVVPEYQQGTITYEKGRFKQKGVFFFTRFFAQEGIGRPEVEAQAFQQDMARFIKKNLPDQEVAPVEPVIVFTNPKAVVDVTGSPTPAMVVDKLKDFIRRKAKEQPVSMSKVIPVTEALPKESIE